MATYKEMLKQIEELKREAETLRQKEVDGVVARIKEAIAAYGLTAEDLGFGQGRKGRKLAPRTKNGAAKFSDGTGNTWAGRGPRPKWLRDALAKGKKLEDFAR